MSISCSQFKNFTINSTLLNFFKFFDLRSSSVHEDIRKAMKELIFPKRMNKFYLNFSLIIWPPILTYSAIYSITTECVSKVPLILSFKMIALIAKLEKNPFITCGFIFLLPVSSMHFFVVNRF